MKRMNFQMVIFSYKQPPYFGKTIPIDRPNLLCSLGYFSHCYCLVGQLQLQRRCLRKLSADLQSAAYKER